MRDAVGGITGDHLVIGTNQLACWVLCDQPSGTRTRVAGAILENSTTIPKARDDFGRLRLWHPSDRPTTRMRVSFGDCKAIFRAQEMKKRMRDKLLSPAAPALCRARVIEKMQRCSGTHIAGHLKLVLGIIDPQVH